MEKLIIEYCATDNFESTLILTYKLRTHSLVDKWINLVTKAQAQYQIDAPDRFYGFGPISTQVQNALNEINSCIATINQHKIIINRSLTRIDNQDTLNYLHHVFEMYHGLLDQQTHDYWLTSPINVRQALANLNVLVHKCESITRGANPRHVVTWYGLPKTETLNVGDYRLFEQDVTFGTVYLNYVEIGKTLEDLANDNDKYIADDAFQPFRHYSADFAVKFWNGRQTNKERDILKEYYEKNKEFFIRKRLPRDHPLLTSGTIPVADLVYTDASTVLTEVEAHQLVKSVTFL